MRGHRAAVQRVGQCKGLCQPRVHVARLSRSRSTPRQHGGGALGGGGRGRGLVGARLARLLAHERIVHQRAELGLVERAGLEHIGLQRGVRGVAAWGARPPFTSAARATSFATAGSSAVMPSSLSA